MDQLPTLTVPHIRKYICTLIIYAYVYTLNSHKHLCCIYCVYKPFILYVIILLERYPHGIFAAGRALPSQKKDLGN